MSLAAASGSWSRLPCSETSSPATQQAVLTGWLPAHKYENPDRSHHALHQDTSVLVVYLVLSAQNGNIS